MKTTSDGPAVVGAAVAAGAIAKAASKKSRSKRKGKKSAKLEKKATRLSKRAKKAEGKGKAGKAARLSAKAGVKTAKKKLVDTKKARIDKKIGKGKENRKALGHKVSEAAKGARDKVVDAAKDKGKKLKAGAQKVKRKVAAAAGAFKGTSMEGPSMGGDKKARRQHRKATRGKGLSNDSGMGGAAAGLILPKGPHMGDSNRLQGAGSEGAPGLGRMSMGRGPNKYDNAHNIGGPSMSADHKMAIDRDKILHLEGNIHSTDLKKKGLSMHGKGGSGLARGLFARNRK